MSNNPSPPPPKNPPPTTPANLVGLTTPSASCQNGCRPARRYDRGYRHGQRIHLPRFPGSSARAGGDLGARAAGPVPGRRFSRSLRGPDAAHAALGVELYDRGRGRRATNVVVGGVSGAAFGGVTRDIHCVTKWSKLDTTWEGVSVDTLLAELETAAGYVLAYSDGGYTTNLPLEEVTGGRPGSPIPTRVNRSRRSTADRLACSSPTYISGRAPSGCAA